MRRPGPLLRRLLRTPVWLYDVGAGWLLGHRFLLLTHRGRRSGRPHRTVLEVVRWDAARSEATVMSGFGDRSDWFLNVGKGGAEEVRIGRRRFRPAVRQLGTREAVTVLAEYEQRNRLLMPLVRLVFSRLVGFRYDGSPQARRRLAEALPLVAFTGEKKPGADQEAAAGRGLSAR